MCFLTQLNHCKVERTPMHEFLKAYFTLHWNRGKFDIHMIIHRTPSANYRGWSRCKLQQTLTMRRFKLTHFSHLVAHLVYSAWIPFSAPQKSLTCISYCLIRYHVFSMLISAMESCIYVENCVAHYLYLILKKKNGGDQNWNTPPKNYDSGWMTARMALGC